MPAWPTSLPNCPLIDGYGEEPQDTKLASQPDQGAAKIRQRFTAAPINVSESYVLTKAQANTFITFFDTDLEGGALTFTKYHPTSDTTKTYRIAPGSVYQLEANGILYNLSLDLQIMP